MSGVALYAGVLALAGILTLGLRPFRIPLAVVLIAVGLLLGRGGLQLVPLKLLPKALAGVDLHVAFLLGVLGERLGRGNLRLPLATIARRSLPPIALAAGALLVSALVLPQILPAPHAKATFLRFYLPQAFVLAVYPLLAIRDLRGRPPEDVGSLFLVAIFLVGAVHSFTPPLLWSRDLDAGVLWRGPILVLGESGALGVAAAIAHLALARRLRLPRASSYVLTIVGLVVFAKRYELWLPFAGLGYGIALGRVSEPGPPIPERAKDALFSEAPFLFLVALAFAPDLYFDSVMIPALVNAVWLLAIVLAVRRWVPGGRELTTGPGLLFLGLTLTVRLDNRMSPITRSTVDFALPAWIVLRLGLDHMRMAKTIISRASDS